MRKLITKDVFSMTRIINKAKLKDKLADLMSTVNTEEKDLEKIGIDAVFTIIECAGNEGVEQEVYKLLEDVCEVKDIEHMELEPLFELLKQLGKENDLIDFFKRVGRLN